MMEKEDIPDYVKQNGDELPEIIDGVKIHKIPNELLLRKKLIDYLWKNHPYPKDIFIKEGKEARLGYEVCIRQIIKFFEEEDEN